MDPELMLFDVQRSQSLEGDAWVLGVRYGLPEGNEEMREDVRSRIWCSYRKNFRAIGGTQLTSDSGWGCTLRCGQMLLAHALVCKHLGRNWRWRPNIKDPTYTEVLKKFLDLRDTLQGEDFGRTVGQWFGPNNVAHAIRKLSVRDSWSRLAVHVAMDMLIVVDDIKQLCRRPHQATISVDVTMATGETIPVDEAVVPCAPAVDVLRSHSLSSHSHKQAHPSRDGYFRSLLLFVPLRLGQDKFNMEYAAALKASLTLPQSVGFIGGKPRHALYVIGYHDDYLFYLDPHVTQPTVHLSEDGSIPDETYHCAEPLRMRLSELDPSVALGFFCKDEADFDDLVTRLREQVLSQMTYMFELASTRPPFMDPPGSPGVVQKEPFQMVDTMMDDGETDSYVMVDIPK
ncbi:hypothetical protein EMCRGX_G026065 [Ephydatia muelleri]